MVPPIRVDLFRLKATECRALAIRSQDGTSRRALEQVAEAWLELAADAEVLEQVKRDRGL
jgi:hypothetical protein